MHNEKMYEAGGHNRCYGMPSVLPAFAAETRAEYKEAVTPIREELKALEEEMDAVRTENKPCRPVSARSGRSVRRPGS